MIHIIENEFLQLTVTCEGGTIVSLIDKKTGEERLWQGEEFWKSRDVVIFPIIGHANPYKSCGKEYAPKSHGVVRYSVLTVAEKTASKIKLALESSEETLKTYPYEFNFAITYELFDDTLKVSYFVASKQGKIPFYLGGHPGLKAPGGSAVIEFENTENPIIYPINSADAIPLQNLQRFVADKEFFKECKTFQLGSLTGGEIYAHTQDGYTYTFKSDCPVVAFWSHEDGGDYVCVEPWWGINDFDGAPREITLKPFINLANENGVEYFYTLKINKN
ncbi:MAG: hypothetical protein E7370_01165 [Clostridiales bacterium]|nr:hypothetical protein [Clostridiales bacterium]